MTQKPAVWSLIAIGACYVYSLIFWYLFLVLLGHKVLGIGIGLGGALYPIFFTVPVLACASIYEFGLQLVLRGRQTSPSMRFLLTLLIPFALISLSLTVFCPMDSKYSFLESFIKKVTP